MLSILIFFIIIGIGSFIQAFSGFALGLIIIGLTAVFAPVSIAVAASSIAILTIINGLSVLYWSYRSIHGRIALLLSVGLLPGTLGGLFLLQHLEDTSPQVLRSIIAVTMLGTGVVLLVRTHPWKRVIAGPLSLLVGFFGGILGGLFATPGPPLVYYLYRQPLSSATIRTTLIAVFVMVAGGRTLYEMLLGRLTTEVLLLSLAAVPIVFVTAWLGERLSAHTSSFMLYRFSTILLIVLGTMLLISN